MYEIYEKLLKAKGVKTADVCKATGIKAPTFSDWKKGKSTPNVDKLILIANYFGVSVQYLRTGKQLEFNEDMSELAGQFAVQDQRTKEYMIKFAKLSDSDKDILCGLIDRLSSN